MGVGTVVITSGLPCPGMNGRRGVVVELLCGGKCATKLECGRLLTLLPIHCAMAAYDSTVSGDDMVSVTE
jgi:hypothetical protein